MGLQRPFYHNPPSCKRLQGAADARRTGMQTYSLYFKCPTTKQMRCPVNAYLDFMLFDCNLIEIRTCYIVDHNGRKVLNLHPVQGLRTQLGKCN